MKLEDIPKKNVFNTPEGYFDKLPGVIQSRIVEKQAQPATAGSFVWVLRYALPVLAVGFALFLIFRQSDPTSTPEDLLATVSTEDLTFYLVESDLTTEDLLDMANLQEDEIDALNNHILYPELDSDLLEDYVLEIDI
ncbi:MAG TPA: hypothetical protein DIS90_15800 [Cytophagales bacterium]|nr:hypothetical protein [Cytophagales bacterium]